MVYTAYDNFEVKGPYQEIKKGRENNRPSTSVENRQQQVRQQAEKNDKHGAWGSVYKNKQNFIDMHIC